ncbi:MAG: STT3 domain-containing protein [Candidatus Pacearchaeota archaeon]|jgi:asparagine N-glycosylation enzyme membrane subunit Stt3
MSENWKRVKENSEKVINFFSQKKVQIIITVIFLLLILFLGCFLRLQNLPILKDQTTGEYLSTDLDSMYFYRIAETKLNEGTLPQIDELRSPSYNITWLNEILPNILIGQYKIMKIFSPDITFNYVATISAVFIFALIIIAFFILCFILTKSKLAGLIASTALAITPSFLFRSSRGFYDHDHLGVLAIILFLIVFILSLKNYEKNWKQTIIWGIITGALLSFVLFSWAGGITFLFIIIPITCFFYYLLNPKNQDKFFIFYLIWIVIFSIISLIGEYTLKQLMARFTETQGILVSFVLIFLILDFISKKVLKKIKENEKKRLLISIISTMIIGIIFLAILKINPLNLLEKAWATLIYPFFKDFSGRLSSTVAENSQPYLKDLISNIGRPLFWMFILGLIFLAINFSKDITNKKNKIILSASLILIYVAILFSRVSDSKILNGENFISQAFYLIGCIIFLIGFFYVYSKEKFNIKPEYLIMFSLALAVAINARAATRSFFLVIPFMLLFSGYSISELIKNSKISKDKNWKYFFIILSCILIIILILFIFWNPLNNNQGIYQISKEQGKYLGPSANYQWQNAMKWVRENTSENSIFVHWWDYGYFIQSMAKRPTVTDGGHSGGDNTDHYIGRYILTTDNPETAYSFMKTWNVSYLLIDPTEMSKYGAFSKIGSNNNWDRLSTGVDAGISSKKDIQETSTGIVRIYNMNSCVDEDIYYEKNQTKVFLPGLSVSKQQRISCSSYLIGIMIEISQEEDLISFNQPIGVFYYKGNQYYIPIKNIYFNNKLIIYNEGLNSTVYIIPQLTESNQGLSYDSTGALMYLSPRVSRSLLGQVYILNDPKNKFSGITLTHKEDDTFVSYIKSIYQTDEEFMYYQGLRGPLKIWKINYPENTTEYSEFLESNFTFGGMDYKFE